MSTPAFPSPGSRPRLTFGAFGALEGLGCEGGDSFGRGNEYYKKDDNNGSSSRVIPRPSVMASIEMRSSTLSKGGSLIKPPMGDIVQAPSTVFKPTSPILRSARSRDSSSANLI